ncbi:hypothetical protein F511_21527 [Dorcoceras hygrometricum]|uniref:Mucin-2-like n=1 Tax=Dorcoceras hygrometricum TaxID=472368 RepID=A0A2Z7ABI7_9LAMI|nr:hypothetical protein F511_21527 [Dorcoceras hygrometricum]
MASSLISSSLHIDFESVFGIEDAGLVQMFESFIAMRLKEFLGCPAVFYEAALTEFFENGSVRDGMVVSTIRGTVIEISENAFAAAFELSVDGLTDLSEVPKDLVFDARSLFSESKEQINWSSLLFGILKDMVTPGSSQAKGFAIQIFVLLKNVPGLELGESRAFPISRVLTEKTVHRYVVINEKVGGEEITDEPRVKKVPKTKATPKKRTAVFSVDEPILKKKRITKGKPVTVETVAIAQEAVPLQIIEATAVVPAEQPPVPKRKSQKRKRRLILGSEDEIVVSEPVVGGTPAEQPVAEVETTVEVQPVVEIVEEQSTVEIAAETGVQEPVDESIDEQMAAEETVVEHISAPAVAPTAKEAIPTSADEMDDIIQQETQEAEAEKHCFNFPYEDIIAQLNVERPVVTPSDTDEEMEAERTIGTDAATDLFVEESEEVAMSYDEKSVDAIWMLMKPCRWRISYSQFQSTFHCRVDEGDWYKANLPNIHPKEKGKEPLLEKDPVKGNPMKEQILLILDDIECLVQLRAQVIDEVAKFFYSFSLKRLANLKIDDSYYTKKELVLSWAEAESTGVALQRKITMLRIDGTWVIEPCADYWKPIPRAVTSCMVVIPSRLSYVDTLPPMSEFFKLLKKRTYRVLFNNVRHDMRDHKNVLSMDFKLYQQKVSNQVGAAALDVVDVRKVVKELDAKVTYLDNQVAAMRSEALDFQAKAEENHLKLSTQLGDIVDFLRGGDAKKGEGSSSHPQPPPDDQGGSGNTGGDNVRTTSIVDRLIDADRRREGRSRGNRSGSYKEEDISVDLLRIG